LRHGIEGPVTLGDSMSSDGERSKFRPSWTGLAGNLQTGNGGYYPRIEAIDFDQPSARLAGMTPPL